MAAREISAIKPTLERHGVKLFGVGVEELGAQEFIDGKFFFGDGLYVDSNKSSFSALGFQKFGFGGLFTAVMSRLSKKAAARAKRLKLGGNTKGDWYQNGGCLVVEKGGQQVLLHFKQKEAAEHVENAEVLKV